MYGEVSQTCIDMIEKSISNSNIDIGNMEVVQLAKESSVKSVESFTSAQEQISKHVCSSYAHDWHSQLMKAIDNQEEIRDIANVHTHVVNNEMIDLYKLLNKSDNQG